MPRTSASPAAFGTDFKQKVVEVANDVARRLTGSFAQVRDLVDDNQLVIGIWQDTAEPDGVGFMIIKGEQILRAVIAANQPQSMFWTAIPCTCLEQAVALKQVAGESDRRH